LNKLTLLLAAGLAAAATAVQAQTTYTWNGSPIPIPDSPDGTCGPVAFAEIYIPDSFTIGSVQVGFYIPHPFQGDLTISLHHLATGRTVLLVDRPGNPGTLIGFGASDYGSGAGQFVLSDSAGSTYDAPQIDAPGIGSVTGRWRPESPLSAFNGETAAGDWRLEVRDCAGMDTGMIVGFSLTIGGVQACYANCDGSQVAPILNVQDLTCFMTRFGQGCSSPQGCYANCDGSTQFPFLNVQDFSCYLQKFATGCTAP